MKKSEKSKTRLSHFRHRLKFGNVLIVITPSFQFWLYSRKEAKLYLSTKFVIQDLWIGIYWRKEYLWYKIYICLIPCFPIIVTIFRNFKDDE